MAPELIKLKIGDEDTKAGCYPMPADIWALGVLVFYMHTKKFPYKASTDGELLAQIELGQIDLKSVKDPQARKLISAILVADPLKRPKIGQVMNHTYFTS